MPKVLGSECYDVMINKILIVCDDVNVGEDQDVNAYVVVMGKALDVDGNPIQGQDVHEKIYLENPILWTPDNVRTELARMLRLAYRLIKRAYKQKADLDVEPDPRT